MNTSSKANATALQKTIRITRNPFYSCSLQKHISICLYFQVVCPPNGTALPQGPLSFSKTKCHGFASQLTLISSITDTTALQTSSLKSRYYTFHYFRCTIFVKRAIGCPTPDTRFRHSIIRLSVFGHFHMQKTKQKNVHSCPK